MNRAARVTSTKAIERFRGDLRKYQESVRDTLEQLGLESRRAAEWMEHDRPKYWPAEVRRAENALVEARNALQRCKLSSMSDLQGSCFDERKAVEACTRRLRRAEEKVRAVRRWRHIVRHETDEFEGALSRLEHYRDTDLGRALAALDRVLSSLAKYTETAANPAMAPPPTHPNSPPAPGEG